MAVVIAGLPEEEFFAQGHRACAGCGEALAVRTVLKAAGKNSMVVSATGCMEVVSTPYPQTAWQVPWCHGAFENAAAIASGIDASLKAQGKREGVNLLALAGDGGTFDIGLQALSGAIERGHKFLFVCTDNSAYMNCLSLDSFVMTEKGLKKITDIKIGEKVYAFDQKNYRLVLKKCTGVFDNGVKKVFEVKTLHHSIKATSNHPFLTLKRNRRNKQPNFVWKTLAQLKADDEIVTLKKLKPGKSFEFKPIKLSKKGDYQVNKINQLKIPQKSSPELMELLGLYVGDGWTRPQKAETGFALPKNTKGRKRLVKLYKKLFEKDLIESNDIYLYIYSVNLARFIESLGFGKNAKEKLVPDWLFTLPEKEKEAFIQGLMLSDGYRIGESKRYVSASHDLLKTLRLFLQTTGYRVGKIHQQTKKKGTHVVHRALLEDSTYGYICFSKKKSSDLEKYSSPSKQRDFLVDNEFFSTEKITSIDFVKNEPTLDLRVEGEHNFVADGFVVHNTGIQRSSATPRYAATTTTPAGKEIHGKIEWKKPFPFIIAAHKPKYVATANVANLIDLHNKAKKAFTFDGPSYIQVFTPCPVGWQFNSNASIEVAKAAVESRVSPLYEIVDGVLSLTVDVKHPKPVESYLKMQGRFKHLDKEEIKQIQAHVNQEWTALKRLAKSKIKL